MSDFGQGRMARVRNGGVSVSAKVLVTQGVFDQAVAYLKQHVEVDGNASDTILSPDELRKRTESMYG